MRAAFHGHWQFSVGAGCDTPMQPRSADDGPAHARGEDRDADLLRDMIGFAAERLMELEVGSEAGAAHGEKNPERLPSATATATGSGRPGLARSGGACLRCARPYFAGFPESKRMAEKQGEPDGWRDQRQDEGIPYPSGRG